LSYTRTGGIPFALWRSLVKNAATGSHETCAGFGGEE